MPASDMGVEYRRMVTERLDSTVLPAAESFGFSPVSTIDSDFSIVRYSKEPPLNKYDRSARRASTDVHTDRHYLTIIIPLSSPEDYEGGGTFYPSDGPGNTDGLIVKPAQGTAILHAGDVLHAGEAVTSGTRLILIAFVARGGRRPVATPVSSLAQSLSAWWHERGWAPSPTVLKFPPKGPKKIVDQPLQ